MLKSHKTNNIGPWFVAVGFIRPHVDWSSPPEFWEYYSQDECRNDVATHKSAPPTSPKIAWVDGGYVDKKSGDLGENYHFNATLPVNDSIASIWRRGYYSAVAYTDYNIGKVLKAIDDLGFTNDTVVALMADHGYQLGEHSMWEKYTNWELSTRVPMMLSVPWKPQSHGIVSTALVENVDMYPTLAAAAGLPAPPMDCDNITKYPGGFNGTCIEGSDLTPLLDEPFRPWKKAAFSQYARCNLNKTTGYYSRCSGSDRSQIEVMGYSIRTTNFRFTEWFDFNTTALRPDFSNTVAMELYDHTNDEGNDFNSYDQVNLADHPDYATIVKEHRDIIREGWVKQRPFAVMN
jgi:arylsulfatase A-like enzyme